MLWHSVTVYNSSTGREEQVMALEGVYRFGGSTQSSQGDYYIQRNITHVPPPPPPPPPSGIAGRGIPELFDTMQYTWAGMSNWDFTTGGVTSSYPEHWVSYTLTESNADGFCGIAVIPYFLGVDVNTPVLAAVTDMVTALGGTDPVSVPSSSSVDTNLATVSALTYLYTPQSQQSNSLSLVLLKQYIYPRYVSRITIWGDNYSSGLSGTTVPIPTSDGTTIWYHESPSIGSTGHKNHPEDTPMAGGSLDSTWKATAFGATQDPINPLATAYYLSAHIDSAGFVAITKQYGYLNDWPFSKKSMYAKGVSAEAVLSNLFGLKFSHPTIYVKIGTSTTTPASLADITNMSPLPSTTGTKALTLPAGDVPAIYVVFYCPDICVDAAGNAVATRYNLTSLHCSVNAETINGYFVAGNFSPVLVAQEYVIFKLVFKGLSEDFSTQLRLDPTDMFNVRFRELTSVELATLDSTDDNIILDWQEGKANWPAIQPASIGELNVEFTPTGNPIRWKKELPDGTSTSIATSFSIGTAKTTDAALTANLTLLNLNNESISVRFRRLATTLPTGVTAPAITNDFSISVNGGAAIKPMASTTPISLSAPNRFNSVAISFDPSTFFTLFKNRIVVVDVIKGGVLVESLNIIGTCLN